MTTQQNRAVLVIEGDQGINASFRAFLAAKASGHAIELIVVRKLDMLDDAIVDAQGRGLEFVACVTGLNVSGGREGKDGPIILERLRALLPGTPVFAHSSYQPADVEQFDGFFKKGYATHILAEQIVNMIWGPVCARKWLAGPPAPRTRLVFA